MMRLDPAPPLSESDFKLFQNLLIRESGLYVAADRQDTLCSVLAERVKENRLATVGDYYARLTTDPAMAPEMKRLIELLTIGETYFFRNFPQFQALEKKVLPPLIRERAQGSRTLTVWSAGCSTGEEPYSLAILLLETLPHPETWSLALLATDVNREALRRAERGVYSARSIRDVPALWREKYFERQGDKYALREDVKRMINFKYFNLAKESFTQPGMQQVDILFCRNVTIYFPLEVTQRIIGKFAESVREGGYYFIGGAETLWQISTRFTQVEAADALLYRKETAGVEEVNEPPTDSLNPEVLQLPSSRRKCHTAGERPSCGAFVGVTTQESPVSGAIHDALKSAYLLANQGRYQDALPLLLTLVASDNLLSEAHYLLGLVYEKTGALEKAIAAFQRVIYINPTLAMAYVALGNLYRFQRHYQKARREFENAIKALTGRPDTDGVSFSDDMTCGSLRMVCVQNLEQIAASRAASRRL